MVAQYDDESKNCEQLKFVIALRMAPKEPQPKQAVES
jgi:hypothetical protein